MSAVSQYRVINLLKTKAFKTCHRASMLAGCLVVLASISQLTACSKGDPIQLTNENYFGTWVHKENAYGNNVRVDNRLLAFYEDSTVTYIRCSKQIKNSTSVSVPDSYISKLTETELILEADLFITTVKMKFNIDRPPFQRNSDWFMRVDGVEFRKLHISEPSDHESWPCRSDEQDD